MIRPLPGYVLIEPIEEELKQGEIYMPETTKDKPMKGKIVSSSGIWPTQFNEIMVLANTTLAKEYGALEEGSTVFYKKWVNQEVEYDSKKYLLVHFNELLAIVE